MFVNGLFLPFISLAEVVKCLQHVNYFPFAGIYAELRWPIDIRMSTCDCGVPLSGISCKSL